MLFKRKRKNIFASKRYKLGTANVFKRYRNPLRIEKNQLKFKIFKLVNIFLIIAILGSAYIFIFSDYYKITDFEVIGNQIVSTDDILEIANNYLATKRFYIFKNQNIFVFNRNKLKDKIAEKVILDQIKIEKILPNIIRINIKEKDAALKWLTAGEEFLVDTQGVIIKRYYKKMTPDIFLLNQAQQAVKPAQADNFLRLTNLNNDTVNLGDTVILPEDIEFIHEIVNKIKQYDYLQIADLSVPGNFPSYVDIKFNPNWHAYFNFSDDIQSQLNRMDILINDKIKRENLPGIEYIDLRYGESVYYQ